jgi:hypothetical protein
MNRNEQIREAIKNIACEAIPDGTNLWPKIAEKIEQDHLLALHSRQKLRPIILFALLILAVAACVYAYHRLMMDPGLQGVEDAGMITDFEQTAEPTIFPTPPWQLGVYNDIAQTSNGITVTLNWAYADESRMAMQLTIDGLEVPEGVDLEELICKPYITSDEGVSRWLYKGGPEILEDQPGKPIILTYVYEQAVDTNQHKYLNLDLDLTLGPCADYLNFDEVYLNKPMPTPPPLIGNYHLRFRVPVYEGMTIAIEQTVDANGLSMRLETITLSPSYTNVLLCYDPPNSNLAPEENDWMPDATIKIGEAEPVIYLNFSDNGGNVRKGQYCANLGFDIFYDKQPTTVVLAVERLYTSLPDLLSEELEMSAKENLHRYGIEVDFQRTEKGYDWKVVNKPSDMTDSDAYNYVIESLITSLEGPWVFVVKIE